MKFLLPMIIALGLMYSTQAIAQTTVTLSASADAMLWSNGANNNYGNSPNNVIYRWTNGGLWGQKRVLIDFDYSTIPQGTDIVDARLSLYYNPNTNDATGVHSGNNEFRVRSVFNSWGETTVTWASQPSSSALNELFVPASTSNTQDYLNLDVTDMVRDQICRGWEGGFILQLNNEGLFQRRGVILASRTHPNASLHPVLEITYAPFSLSIQPNAQDGKDATVWNNGATTNYGNSPYLNTYLWSNSSLPNPLDPGIKRFFTEFDLGLLPPGATVTDARLSLFHDTADPDPGQTIPFSQNWFIDYDLAIQRVTQSWTENQVTWANQPTATTANQVVVGPATTTTQDYTNIDVTTLVNDMLANQNFGFLFRMEDESDRRAALSFASSDNANTGFHPLLVMEYTFCDTAPLPRLSGDPLILEPVDIDIFPNPSSGQVTISSL
ncbi:MAG: DNRLRE domain-containing protein, partial [Bacteroidota bacterium]